MTFHAYATSQFLVAAWMGGCYLFALGQADPISGGAGWVGAGLLGAVLAWLTMVHLPAKDKQLKDLLDSQALEREADRKSRNETSAIFQKAINDLEIQHVADARDDRDAFMARNSRIEDALRVQTAELKSAILQSCRFQSQPQHQFPPHQSSSDSTRPTKSSPPRE